MTTNGNAPVLVGAGQLLQRDVEPEAALDPLEMLDAVARRAAGDAGAGERALGELDLVGVVDVIGWRPKNAARLLAERLDARPKREIVTAIGGEVPLSLVNHVAREIASGRVRSAFVGGSSTVRTMRRAGKAGLRLPYPQGGDGDPELFGENKKGASELEVRYGLAMPIDVYPIFENALRARRGLDVGEHQRRLGALMAPFTRVAAANEYAWFPVERSAEELVRVTAENRMIAFPYPKYLNAVIETDQAAGVLLMSRDAALALGIPAERLVYFWGGANGAERQWFVSERPNFHSCASMRTTLESALAESGVAAEELGYLDLYSCFPVAVELAAEVLGAAEDDPRGFTVTGGLPYAGGPGNNYTLHSLANMIATLRADRGAPGLVTGNGWYLTKHSATVLAADPPPHDVAKPPPSAAEEPAPAVPVAAQAEGRATVETYTVRYDRDGAPARGIVIARLDDGRRVLTNTESNPGTLAGLVAEELVGRAGRVSTVDGANRFEPH